MSDIAPVTGPGGPASLAFERLEVTSRQAAAAAPTRFPDRPSDRVELSDRARLLSKLASLPEMRQDLIDRIRTQIADGTYETEEKLEAALQGLAEDLDD